MLRPERSRPVADQAVQVVGIDTRRRRDETMRVGIVLDRHRQARRCRGSRLRAAREPTRPARRARPSPLWRYATRERETRRASTIQGSDRRDDVSRTQPKPPGPLRGTRPTSRRYRAERRTQSVHVGAQRTRSASRGADPPPSRCTITPLVPLTRRQFLWSAAASVGSLRAASDRSDVIWPELHAQSSGDAASGLFRHGVASGDPLTDRVILWTRVTPADACGPHRQSRFAGASGAIRSVSSAIAQGAVQTTSDRDFTVKVDAGGLQPRPAVLLRVRERRRPVARRPDADAAGRRRRSRSPRLRLLLQLPVRLLQCLPLPRQPDRPRRRRARRRLHLRVRERRVWRRQRAAPDPGAAARGGHPERLPDPLRHLSLRPGSPGGPSSAPVHRRLGRPRADQRHVGRTAPQSQSRAGRRATGPTRKAAAYRAYLEWMPIRESAGRRHPPVPQLPVRHAGRSRDARHARAARQAGGDDGSSRRWWIPARSILGADAGDVAVRRSCARRSGPGQGGACWASR